MIRRILCAAALPLLMFAPAGAEPVTVVLQSGERLTGIIDPRTDQQTLWLRFERGRATLRQPIAWTELSHALLAGAAMPASVLREHSKELATNRASIPGGQRSQANRKARDEPSGAQTVAGPPASVRVEASTANWDRDVEADGLLVTLTVVDDKGLPVAISGTLEVELIGQPFAPTDATRRQSYPILASWVRQVRPDDAPTGEYEFRLEFQALHPDFNLQVGPSGLVHARLSVPGSGVLEASTATIALRQLNPLRDQWQIQGQGRFFPQEQTGRSKMLTVP